MQRYDTYVRDPLVEQDRFIGRRPAELAPPRYGDARLLFPEPFWEGHPAAIDAWNRTWEIAFGNLRSPRHGSGFVAPFIDTAFNDCLFMWGSCFILMFCRCGARAFDLRATLDTFYAKQHPDGFICREIVEEDGADRFERFDPTSTGPNLLAWTEWEWHLATGDRARLGAVLPPLLAYHPRLAAHLRDPATVNRPHRIPALSADHALHEPGGGYWRGGVWAPATCIMLEGLRASGEHALAHEIARNHHDNVAEVFLRTGTFWENYAPEAPSPGAQARRDFVGWTGLPPIAVLVEHVMGIRLDAPRRRLVWDVRLLEGHGAKRHPVGSEGLVDLRCSPRSDPGKRPRVEASSTVPLELEIRWQGGRGTMRASQNASPPR